MATRTFKPSFAGGEISEEMFARLDDAKFQSGVSLLQNMITTPLGPAVKRPGFEDVNSTKNNGVARLIPFTYSSDQTMVMEMGAGYFRFHTQGETLQYSASQPAFKASGVVTYTVANPTVLTLAAHGYATDDLVVLAIVIPYPMVPNIAYPAGLGYGPYKVDVIDANTFYLKSTATGGRLAVTAPQAAGGLAVQPDYGLGDLVTYRSATYYRTVLPPGAVTTTSWGAVPVDADPSSSGDWYRLPADLSYEIPNPYTVDDLFDIQYVQSNDVVTLVHSLYPPAELRRLSATAWTYVPISFAPKLAPPAGVNVVASPGYQAQIASVVGGLITTVSNHTLALGDGIYINPDSSGMGFYLVDKVPADGTGALVPNQLYVMDYDGNLISSPGFGAGATIQYGPKIFDITNYYVVTAIAQDGVQESAVSAEVSMLNNLNVTGSFNTITWSAVPDAFRYYVYKRRNGLYGYIGETPSETLTFHDNNIATDMSITPPVYDSVFVAPGDYPGAVGYCQQRRTFAATENKPQALWLAKSATESDFSYSLPVKDTDRIAITIAARELATIKHIVPLNQLVLLTSSVEICVTPQNSDVITPSSIAPRPQSYIGASNVQPTVANNTLVFCAARGGHVREMGYQWQLAGYMTGDMSLRAAHLFDGLTIVAQAYMKSPWPVIWFVSSNGNLLGLTYVPEEQIGAWHHHVTMGAFESIACVAEGAEDRLYAVVRRTINGFTVRRIERMSTRAFSTPSDAMRLDAAQIYDGAPATVFTGLDHLEGQLVSILGDGAVMNPQTVSAGSVTIEYPCSKVHIGLPYTVDIHTLPLALQIDGLGQGRAKNINHVWIRVKDSSSIWAGPDLGKLVEYAQRRAEPYGSPPSLVTDEIKIPFFGTWQDSGQIFIQQTDPLPLTVIGLTIEVAIGG